MQVEDAGGSEGRTVMVRIGGFALTRKGADFPQVSHGENPEQTVNRGSVYTLVSGKRCDIRHGIR